jgi:uncharacterized protein (DUF1015 family)
MARILPFKAVRPAKDKVHLVVSRSVESYSLQEINAKMLSNPFSFLHVIQPVEGNTRPRAGSREQLVLVKKKYREFLQEHVLEQDKKECYYLYEQKKGNKTYTGIVAIIAVDDYLEGVVKIHEQTLTAREQKLKEYLEICDFNAEPVCFCYPDDPQITSLMQDTKCEAPEYYFTTSDRITHSLWLIHQSDKIQLLQQAFKKMPAVYIADGHHRSASSALLGKYHRALKGNHTGKEGFNFYMGIFFPESVLSIYDFNRVVKDLNNRRPEELLKALEEHFEVKKIKKNLYKPTEIHEISMYLNAEFYSLKARPQVYASAQVTNKLDAHILTRYILEPLLGIKDLKNDKRIAFVPGSKGPEELKQVVDSGKYAVAFGLYPVSMEQLKEVADTGNIMPPKTTYIEPKLRSALLIYDLAEKGY